MNAFKILFSLFFSMLLMVTQAFADTDISGKYSCSWASADGSNAFTEPLTISKHGDGFSFQWLASDTGFPVDLGTGMYTASVPNAVAVAFHDTKDPTQIAAALYQIKPDGSLHGGWLYIGSKTGGNETCTKSTDNS